MCRWFDSAEKLGNGFKRIKGYDIFQDKCTYYESLFSSFEHHLAFLENRAGLVIKTEADHLIY